MPPATTTATAPGERRQCWECRRRRLVCDSARPACNKCRAAGTECPGYSGNKPLKWITPGKVKSRNRGRPKGRAAADPATSPSPALSPSSSSSSSSACSASSSATLTTSSNSNPHGHNYNAPVPTRAPEVMPHPMGPAMPAASTASFDSSGSSATWSPRTDSLDEPIGSPNDGFLEDPSVGIFQQLQTGNLVDPMLFTKDLGSETRDFVNAVIYFNTCIYPDVAVMHDLPPNPYLDQFPPVALHQMPVSVCHTIAYLVLGHRLQRRGSNEADEALTQERSRLYHHRGEAMRCLGEDIANATTQCNDATILSVLMFLFADVRQFAAPYWRYHLTGATQLILLRGGLRKLMRSSTALRPSLLYFMIIGVMGNTTSPATDQIPATSSLDLIDLMAESYGEGLSPSLFCPPTLMLDIIRINHLRLQGSCNPSDEFVHLSATTLLEQIQAFSPEQWIVTSTFPREEWDLLGRIYQSAILVYCISSLQSVGVLPYAADLVSVRAAHGSRLCLLLRKALASPMIRKCMTWPLIVAGVHAASSSPGMRTFVDTSLTEMSRDLATPIPATARDVLHTFWTSGKDGWDACFDQSYAFVS
ncbi:hypothetical protein P170DRAFT_508133 [Aspergillus steynii IBT 23096]|uniref:Zn(2)-C6 fungal-type domain-containing protein n=1 Tax=Aspergillus steynii IBT 23096 TaxID=1392250 RepID=A0A2I2GKY4_9EURO|nr:uncharacterized protein P170DRAFT_508133 [Aspergillus steynii IBT 23096]PLB53538.1 hypothetical protein P170DRAFT_508133 [Aspergillus steynii IBT 23096]